MNDNPRGTGQLAARSYEEKLSREIVGGHAERLEHRVHCRSDCGRCLLPWNRTREDRRHKEGHSEKD